MPARPSSQLNKFCVTPRHFLLVTKDFVPQTSPLTPPELTATYSILKQLSSREKREPLPPPRHPAPAPHSC